MKPILLFSLMFLGLQDAYAQNNRGSCAIHAEKQKDVVSTSKFNNLLSGKTFTECNELFEQFVLKTSEDKKKCKVFQEVWMKFTLDQTTVFYKEPITCIVAKSKTEATHSVLQQQQQYQQSQTSQQQPYQQRQQPTPSMIAREISNIQQYYQHLRQNLQMQYQQAQPPMRGELYQQNLQSINAQEQQTLARYYEMQQNPSLRAQFYNQVQQRYQQLKQQLQQQYQQSNQQPQNGEQYSPMSQYEYQQRLETLERQEQEELMLYQSGQQQH